MFGSTQTKPGQTKPGQTKPGQTKPGQTKPGQTKPGQTRPGRTEPGTTRPPDGGSSPFPIEDHAVIGDLRTAALVSKDGTLSFLCAPAFDSPTVFAQLLDPNGGHFRISPLSENLRTTQRYLPDTNVLVTRLSSVDGLADVTDWMPIAPEETPVAARPQYVVRQLRVLRGTFVFEMTCAPRFDYGRASHGVAVTSAGGVFTPAGAGPVLALQATVPVVAQDGDLTAHFALSAGQTACFVLVIDPEDLNAPLDQPRLDQSFLETVGFWHRWIEGSAYRGRWREIVDRSALLLKLMTSAQHGAMVAAVTFGLPERVGGAKNWDYRYCWIRDTSFAMYALVRLGLVHEMHRFVDWIGARVRDCADSDADVPLRIMYGLDGRADLPESELPGLLGWDGSRPVRIGNAAADQLQLDIFGELMDALYLANKYGSASSYDGWRDVCRVIEWVSANWRRPDRGVWESRGEDQHFLYSRLMCWVAVDRAIRLANKRSYPAPLPQWNQTRLEIHASIHDEFWDEGLNSFVHVQGGDTVDGALLLMPMLRFISPQDPRWLGTLDLIRKQLVVDALVFRRPPGDEDAAGGEEGAFLACSFWYVEALARSGEVTEARLVFDKLLGYANHVGLYAEELSFSGRHLGNFPQVLTHLALISAASFLDRALSGDKMSNWA